MGNYEQVNYESSLLIMIRAKREAILNQNFGWLKIAKFVNSSITENLSIEFERLVTWNCEEDTRRRTQKVKLALSVPSEKLWTVFEDAQSCSIGSLELTDDNQSDEVIVQEYPRKNSRNRLLLILIRKPNGWAILVIQHIPTYLALLSRSRPRESKGNERRKEF